MIQAFYYVIAALIMAWSAGTLWLAFFAPRQKEMTGWARGCCQGQCLAEPRRSMLAETPSRELRSTLRAVGTIASERPTVTDVTVEDHLRNPPHHVIT